MKHRGLAVVVLALVAVALGASSVEARGSAADLTVEIIPLHPTPNSEYTIVVKGNTADLGWVLLYETRSACPSKIGTLHTINVTEEPVSGSFSRTIGTQLDGSGPVRLCLYLQPAYVENGQTSIGVGEPALARAEVVVTGALRLPPRTGVVGLDRLGDFLGLITDLSGRRFVSLMIECGGPHRTNGWFAKRFLARINLPLAKTLRWSGAVKPDNGPHYEPPYPPHWTRPVHASFDLHFAIDEQGGLIRGTTRLTSPGLPCPTMRHLTPNR